MKITFVKKIKADGEPRQKCADVENRLVSGDQMRFIDDIVVADERDPQSEGIQLAQQYQVERAPFFLVEDESGMVKVYTIYFQLVKEVFTPLQDQG